MARTLPLHSLCITLTETALTATAMSHGALGHEQMIEGLRWELRGRRACVDRAQLSSQEGPISYAFEYRLPRPSIAEIE